MIPEVDDFLEKTGQWQAGLSRLREILLGCSLTETLKWKQPCYTFNGANIAIIGKFKDHFILSFFKGSLLGDPDQLLTKPGENTQAGRVIRFKNLSEVEAIESTISAYIFEAIEVEKAGIKVEVDRSKDFDFPNELLEKFKENKKFESAFLALTPGRQKGYNLFFSAAKQSKTRTARVEKYIPRILDGFGIHDCTCGLSKRKPNCDGSHKELG